MNANTFAGFSGGTAVGQIASQTLASTTETEFVYNTGASPTTAIAVLHVPLSTEITGAAARQLDPSVNAAQTVRTGNRFGSQFFNTGNIDNGVPFLVRVCGLATPASNAGNALQIFLYLGTSKSGTAIAQTADTNQASTVVAKPFILEAQLVWASGPRTIHGQFWWKLEGTSSTDYVTWAELTNNGASVDLDDLNFCASAQWGDAVGGVCAVSEFSISRM